MKFQFRKPSEYPRDATVGVPDPAIVAADAAVAAAEAEYTRLIGIQDAHNAAQTHIRDAESELAAVSLETFVDASGPDGLSAWHSKRRTLQEAVTANRGTLASLEAEHGSRAEINAQLLAAQTAVREAQVTAAKCRMKEKVRGLILLGYKMAELQGEAAALAAELRPIMGFAAGLFPDGTWEALPRNGLGSSIFGSMRVAAALEYGLDVLADGDPLGDSKLLASYRARGFTMAPLYYPVP
jgi:hypothetical protein